MRNVSHKLTFPLFLCLSLLLANLGSLAQDLDDVTIGGKITDSNGLAIVGAAVTTTRIETGDQRTVTTDGEGFYRLIKLQPGTYKVKTSANGFGAQEKIDLTVGSGQNVRLDFTLAPAAVSAEQTVTVTEEDAPLIDTTRTTVGGTVTQREIEELPNNTRNPLDLILTLGGTAEEALSTRDLAEDRNANPRGTPAEQGIFSLSGGASYSNNITIDGLDNNDDKTASDRFQPSLEAVVEVQVITNQFSAEYGRASGGRVNLRTRAGSNRFRGRAFMFFRDDNLNANSWFNNLTIFNPDGSISREPLARLPLTEYNPGFTLNGPIVFPYFYNGTNRTFFSLAYEYGRLADTTLIDAYVPVVPNPRFRLPASTGGAPTCDSNPPVAMPGEQTPCAAPEPTAAYVAPYNITVATPNLSHVLTARIDHNLFRNNNLTFGFQFGRKNNRRQSGTTTTRIEDALQGKISNTEAYNFTDNHVFGANLVNQFRAQWSRYEPSFQTDKPFDPVVLISYRDPIVNASRTLTAGNSTSSSLQSFADSRRETRLQLQNSLTYLAGAQTFKLGFDLQKVRSETHGLEDATGTFNFNSVLNYQNNVLSRYRQNFGTAADVKNTYWSVFLNDEIKLLSNLTLNAGLRYERETAVSDENNFGPRIGLAWDPLKTGKSVVRFGAGVFYNRVLLRTVGDFMQNRAGGLVEFDTNTIGTSAADARRVAILGQIAARFPNSYASAADLKNLIRTLGLDPNSGFSGNISTAGNPLRSVDPQLRIPESYQFNIGFEREIGRGFVFEINYTHNKTAHLWREYNPNAPVLPAGYAEWTEFLLANPFIFTNANGTTRTYNFVLGSTTDGSGVGSGCSFTQNSSCNINLNTVNTSAVAPRTAIPGVSTNATGSPLGIALAAVACFRPDQSVEETARVASLGNARYHGLILEMRSRYRNLGYGFGSSFRAVYTLSKMKDDGLNNTSNAEINTDFGREWARSLQDRRHRFALSGVFETPFWLGRLRFSPVFRYGSSAPFNIGIGSDRNLNDQSTDRLNFSGDVKNIEWRAPGSPFPAELASQFSLPPIGAKSGNLPRNAGRGPGFYTFDLSVTREWRFGERFRLRPVVQFDNILNAVVFSYGSEYINLNALSATPTQTQLRDYQNFLVPTRTYRPRQTRLGVRLDF